MNRPACAPDGRMAPRNTDLLVFGRFRLDPERRVLYRDDTLLAPGGRALALLLVLARRAGEVLSHRELERAVWSGTVDASNVRAQVCRLRKALGDGADGQRFIVNVMGRGYSFVGEIDLLRRA